MVVRLLGPRDEPITIVLLNGDSINCHLNLNYSIHRLVAALRLHQRTLFSG